MENDDLDKIKNLLTSTTTKNKILSNVLILLIDSLLPQKKDEIIQILKNLLIKNENNFFLKDFVNQLILHNENFKIIYEKKIENELIVPAEILFFEKKKKNKITIEFLKKVGPIIEKKMNDSRLEGNFEKGFLIPENTKQENIKQNIENINKETKESINKESKENINKESKGNTNKRIKMDVNSDRNSDKSILDNKFSKFDILYPPLQCRICGIRFFSSDLKDEKTEKEYVDHIENHSKKKNLNENKEYFFSEENWFEEKLEKIDFSFNTIKNEIVKETNFIFVNKKLIFCSLCKNKMNVFWNDEEDTWCIRDGVKLGDEYVHKECAF